jgi:ABC-type transport system substrate-binding protein
MRALRILAAPALIAAALAGCGGSSRPPAPAAREFIDVLPALPRSLDPGVEQGAAFDALETSLAGTLVRPAGRPPGAATLAPAGAVSGFLASSWRALQGGDYVFELRRGVRSAYGHTLSGADVAFSFARELALSAQARFLAGVAGIALRDPVTVLGPRRVRVNVTAPSPFTLAALGDFRFGVLDAAAVRAHERAGDPLARRWLAGHLAFYGPYELLGFAPASKLLLRANPSFWRALAFKLVAVEAAPSAALRLDDVASAEASHTDSLDWADFETAAHTSGLRALALASTAVSVLVPDERNAAFAKVAVRRALSLAIDRGAVSRAAFAGLAPPARTPLGATVGAGEPSYGHDVALARRLLARAGYPHGLSMLVGVCVAQTPEGPAELAAIAGALRAIGVHVRVRRVASGAALAALERSGALGAVLETSVSPLHSSAVAIEADFLRGSPANLEGYDDAALQRYAAALDDPAVLARALAVLDDSYPVIALVAVPGQLVTRAGIGGYAAYPGDVVYYDQLHG